MNYIKGHIVSKNDDCIIVATSSGIGYRLETFGLDITEENFNFNEIDFFVEETFNTQSGIKTRYAIIDYDALEFLWTLKKSIKKIPMKVLASLVNQFTVHEINEIIASKDVKLLTSKIKGLGKANAEKICEVNISTDVKPKLSSEQEKDLNEIRNNLKNLGRKLTSDESLKISEKLSEGKGKQEIFEEFIKNNGTGS